MLELLETRIDQHSGTWLELFFGEEASPGSDVSSIPIARSISIDDSIALTRPSR
jgi:hypothetical protein